MATDPPLTDEQLAAIDLITSAFRMSAGGVDVTQWGPNLRELDEAEAGLRSKAEARAATIIRERRLKLGPAAREALVRELIAQMRRGEA